MRTSIAVVCISLGAVAGFALSDGVRSAAGGDAPVRASTLSARHRAGFAKASIAVLAGKTPQAALDGYSLEAFFDGLARYGSPDDLDDLVRSAAVIAKSGRLEHSDVSKALTNLADDGNFVTYLDAMIKHRADLAASAGK